LDDDDDDDNGDDDDGDDEEKKEWLGILRGPGSGVGDEEYWKNLRGISREF
jgi:hypothetical protein